MKLIFLLIATISCDLSFSQNKDSIQIKKIFNEALENGECYQNLEVLCKDIGHRLTASPGAEKAIEWGEKLLEKYKFDNVYLQPVQVPNWKRGGNDAGWFSTPEFKTQKKLSLLALGGSIGTNGTLTAEIIEVKTFEELEKLGKEKIEGKIVFFNRAMDRKNISTFKSYGGCYDQRGYGAIYAAQYGAKAVLVRSLSLKMDNNPHTGSMMYLDSIPKIPAAAISTRDCVKLKQQLLNGKKVTVSLNLQCKSFPDVTSYNVIGEIKGSENPENIILVGGHLDSWDVGEGAHDDGAGIVHSIEALRLLKATDYKPKNTIRVVLFINEENGNRGGKEYARVTKEKNINHIAAIESDRGGFSPRGFTIDGTPKQVKKLQTFKDLLKPYNLHILEKGYGGVDIGPLKNGKIALIGLVPDSQRYFDHHHAQSDLFENVNQRELELGAASCAALLYLIDQYGIN